MKFEYKSPSKERQKAVYNHLVLGMGKEKACMKAGLSHHTADKLFDNYRVRAYKESWKAMEAELSDDKKWLIDFYRSIIKAPLGQVVKIKKVRKVPAVQAGDPDDPKMVKVQEDIEEKLVVTNADKMNAAKELSILLGIREERTKVTTEADLIATLQQRRKDLSNDSYSVSEPGVGG